MAKILAWLILIFLVLLALRVVALRKAHGARKPARTAGSASAADAEPMVRCVRCGVFLPRTEAKKTGDGFVCTGVGCLPHG